MTYEELVGQKLVWGIDGKRVTPEVVSLFRETHAGGLILFRRNIDSAGGVRKLISDLEHSLGRRLLIMVDHEGGRVIHLGEGITVFPDAEAAGLAGHSEWVAQQGEIEAAELRTLGIDLNLAPVLDVVIGAYNPAIGTRSYGRDPELVARMGIARIKGMQSKGLSACAKHFPGLGAAGFDPHKELPVIQKTWKVMKAVDLLPFQKAIEAGVDTVMSSHPVYPELDSSRLPATFSRKIIHDSLRLEFGFKGAILTDDLKMGAISKSSSFREAVSRASGAGHDLLLVCSDPKAQRQAFEGLVWAYRKKELKTDELEASVERIRQLTSFPRKRESIVDPRLKHAGMTGDNKSIGGEELAQKIARGGAKILGTGKGLLPFSPEGSRDRSLLVLFPDLSPVAGQFFIEPELLDPKTFLKRVFLRFGASPKSIETLPLDPGPREREKIKALARSHDLVIFFCSDAHRFKGTRELLKRLEEEGKGLVVILLREPQDFEWVGAGTACVTAHGFRATQVEAAVEKLFSPD